MSSVTVRPVALSTPTTVVSMPMFWITACNADNTSGWSSTTIAVKLVRPAAPAWSGMLFSVLSRPVATGSSW